MKKEITRLLKRNAEEDEKSLRKVDELEKKALRIHQEIKELLG